MIVRFQKSPEAKKLGLIYTTALGYGEDCTPFYDPDLGRIRLQHWFVDPANRTVFYPKAASRFEGTFAVVGGQFVISNLRAVPGCTVSPWEAKEMILRFLSSAEAAELPRWVEQSRSAVEAETQHGIAFPVETVYVGPWHVCRVTETVLLPGNTPSCAGRSREKTENS